MSATCRVHMRDAPGGLTMDLVTACPFRLLAMVFFAVPFGVIAGVYAADLSASLRRHGGRARHD